jgi:hypothetical protein
MYLVSRQRYRWCGGLQPTIERNVQGKLLGFGISLAGYKHKTLSQPPHFTTAGFHATQPPRVLRNLLNQLARGSAGWQAARPAQVMHHNVHHMFSQPLMPQSSVPLILEALECHLCRHAAGFQDMFSLFVFLSSIQSFCNRDFTQPFVHFPAAHSAGCGWCLLTVAKVFFFAF